jgi:hypothetical protein
VNLPDGKEAARILAENGVQRAQVRAAMCDQGPDISVHRRGPQPGREHSYERRDGLTRLGR